MTATADVPAGQDPFLIALSAARTALGQAGSVAGWQTADQAVLEGIADLARLRGLVEAVHLSLVRELDTRGLARSAPVATTAEGFLRTTLVLDAGQARRDVAAARATAPGRPLAVMADELADGRRTRAHLDVAVRCLDRVPTSTLAEPTRARTVVEFLRTAAEGASPLDMHRAARQMLARLDPEGVEARDGFDPRSYERRFLDVHTDGTGMVVGSFQLDPVAGATLRNALDTCSAPTAGADGEPDRRQARERRADALVAVADIALGVAVPRRGERPRVVVHVEPDQLRAAATGPGPVSGSSTESWTGSSTGPGWAYLEGGEPVPPPLLRRLTCDAVLQRVVMSPSLGPLDVGREHRLVTLAQRRALEARDGGCIIPGCTVPAGQCDAHHVVHWVDGGRSDVSNYVLVCGGHHTAVHAGTWAVTVWDGLVLVTPPRRVDPTRTPRIPQQHAVRAALRGLRGPVPAAGAPTGEGDTSAGDTSERDTSEGDTVVGDDDVFAGLPLPAARPPAPDLPADVFLPRISPPPNDLPPSDPDTGDGGHDVLRGLFRSLPSHPVRAGP